MEMEMEMELHHAQGCRLGSGKQGGTFTALCVRRFGPQIAQKGSVLLIKFLFDISCRCPCLSQGSRCRNTGFLRGAYGLRNGIRKTLFEMILHGLPS